MPRGSGKFDLPAKLMGAKKDMEVVMSVTANNRMAMESHNLSRRQILRSAALTAGGVVVLFAALSPADAKMSYQASGYQPTPKGDQNCAGCSLFKTPSSCILVDGNISPNGWCRFYRKKT
ncbi:MAG TPA: hypothetical protein VLC74_03435 [Rhizomicrobium sp.]|nr:hypothetical protein [Rhizomicrobium sp.]